MKGTAEDIIGSLIDVVNQACQVEVCGNDIFCSNMGLSAYTDALHILEVEGYAKQIKSGKRRGLYKLAWEPKFAQENLLSGKG